MSAGVRFLFGAGLLLLVRASGRAEGSGMAQLESLQRSIPAGGPLESQAAESRFEDSPPRAGPAALEAPPEGLLLSKARLFETMTRRDHRPWLGLVLTRAYDDNGNFQRYMSLNDSMIWTGTYIAAEAYRYAATGEPEALQGMEESLWGLHALHEATGKPGLVARVLIPKDYAEEIGLKAGEDAVHQGQGAYADWVWVGDLSNDQYDGYFFGVSAAWPHIKDESLRQALREDLRQIGLHVIRNNMRIKDDGETFIDFRANYYYQDRWPKALRAIPLPPMRGANSVFGLHIMKICALLTGDPELEKYYREIMILKEEMDLKMKDSPNPDEIIEKNEGRLTRVARAWSGEKVTARQKWLRSSIGKNLDHMALHDLSRLEDDPELQAAYRSAFKRTHQGIAGEGNTFWNFLYAAQFPEDKRAIKDGVDSLRLFPSTPIFGRRNNSDDPALPKHKGLNGDTGLPWCWYTDKPLPMDRRAVHAAFAWQSNPYKLNGGQDNYEGSGAAYLVAYWLGRRQGFISPTD